MHSQLLHRAPAARALGSLNAVPHLSCNHPSRQFGIRPTPGQMFASPTQQVSHLRAQTQAVEDVPLSEPMPKGYDEMKPDQDKKRRAGVILHPTSLPGPYGIGEMGQESRNFVDWLADAGMQVWQMLPMVPPDPQFYSPYSGTDANCGNPLMISIDELIKDGLLEQSEAPPHVPVGDVDFPAVSDVKYPLLKKAAGRLLTDQRFKHLHDEYVAWRKKYSWVEDSALFDVARNLPDLSQSAWWDWPEPLRLRQPEALKEFSVKHKQEIDEFIACQYLFDKQWKAIKAYANDKNIKMIGDMPIYVGGHSADVWANRHLFELTEAGTPNKVSGVPPDNFSATGQLWGSPLYRWEAHAKEEYSWWALRLARALELYDETRIDHFRGFAGYWSVGAEEETAMNGHWMKGPGLDLFAAVKAKIGAVPILAEDLGVITPDVVKLREDLGAPGMVVMQFAFGSEPDNVHLPHNHYENCFVYPGTHDNQTALGWFKSNAGEQDKQYIKEYLGSDGSDFGWDLIKVGMRSCGRTFVVMMQDIMRLDDKARMNSPGRAEDNWKWRMGDSSIWQKIKKDAEDLKHEARMTNRIYKPTEIKQ